MPDKKSTHLIVTLVALWAGNSPPVDLAAMPFLWLKSLNSGDRCRKTDALNQGWMSQIKGQGRFVAFILTRGSHISNDLSGK